jgi:hypothetical protein
VVRSTFRELQAEWTPPLRGVGVPHPDWSNGSSSLLEYGTKLVGTGEGFWQVVLYPDAGEAGAVFHSARTTKRGGGPEADPDDAARVATRRAKSKVRRYCASNRLTRFGTLTHAGEGCWDPLELRREMALFFRRLRTEVGKPYPYVWVGEWHKSHGLHAHYAMGRFVRRRAIDEAWGRGYIKIKLHGDLPYASTALVEARHTARYLSKYMTKSVEEVAAGLHRYEVGQGFQPTSAGFKGRSSGEVLGWAADQMGGSPDFVKPSSEWEHYLGPPAVFASWT